MHPAITTSREEEKSATAPLETTGEPRDPISGGPASTASEAASLCAASTILAAGTTTQGMTEAGRALSAPCAVGDPHTEEPQCHVVCPRSVLLPVERLAESSSAAIITDAALAEPGEADGPLIICPVSGPEALDPQLHHNERRVINAQQRRDAITAYDALIAQGLNPYQAHRQMKRAGIKASPLTIWRWKKQFARTSDLKPTQRGGKKPAYMPCADELALVRRIWMNLDAGKDGGSDVAAFRLAACSANPAISEQFRAIVLKRHTKSLPPSWRRLLDAPPAVVDLHRDAKSLALVHITTPRNRTYIDTDGIEKPLQVGTIFESDDGTVNFPCWIPWPFGGDACSEKFGVKVGRFQLLPIVDVHSGFCPCFHFVVRPASSYRGEDAMALFGDCFSHIGRPEVLRLERGSWESEIVKSACAKANVPIFHAWTSKQKAAVENFFNRLWTPLSLVPGHVGRDRGRYKQVTDLLLRCQAGHADPRAHFLALEQAIQCIGGGINWVNTEPMKSARWGQWIPQQRFQQHQAAVTARRLLPEMRVYFSREQCLWTARKSVVGGTVAGPLINFPVYFQASELMEFDGCKIKCLFDPYDEPCVGTLILQDEWRGYKPGHLIARDIPALEMPPQIVLAADGWAGQEKYARSLQVRKQVAKLVRTETWNWLGARSSQSRTGAAPLLEARSVSAAPLQITSSGSHAATKTARSAIAEAFE